MNQLESGQRPSMSRRSFSRLVFVTGAILALPVIDTRAAYGEEASRNDERTITDDAGREVCVSISPQRLVPSGKYAESVLSALCADRLVSVAKYPDSPYWETRATLHSIPETGQLFVPEDNSSSLDINEIEMVNPDLIIDVGDYKDSMEAEFNNLEAQADTPTLYVDASFGNLASAFRTLGTLLDCSERAERIADYIDNAVGYVESCSDRISETRSVLFCEGETGLSVRGCSSYQAQAIEKIGAESAAKYNADINSVDIDHADAASWNPDVILFSNSTCYEKILQRESPWDMWQIVPAIQHGQFYSVPRLEYSWFGSPPLLAQSLGLLWLGSILYPDIYELDLHEETRDFYHLFFNTSLDDDEIETLLSTMQPVPMPLSTEEAQTDPVMSSRVFRIVINNRGLASNPIEEEI